MSVGNKITKKHRFFSSKSRATIRQRQAITFARGNLFFHNLKADML